MSLKYCKTYLYGYLIQSFYLSPKDSDLTIVVDGHSLYAHKLVLIRGSIVFRKMLFGDFKESNDKQIEIKDTNLETFKVLLKYCYKEDLLTEDWPSDHHLFVIDVLKCAHLYQMKNLYIICELKLIGQMSVHNVTDILEIGLLLQSKRIKFFAQKFAKHRPKDLMTSQEFLNNKSIEILNVLLKAMPSAVDPLDVIKSLISIIQRNKDEVEDNEDWHLFKFVDCIQIENLSIDVLNYIKEHDSNAFPEFALKRIQLLEEKVNNLNNEVIQLKTSTKLPNNSFRTRIVELGQLGQLVRPIDDNEDDWDAMQLNGDNDSWNPMSDNSDDDNLFD